MLVETKRERGLPDLSLSDWLLEARRLLEGMPSVISSVPLP